MGTEDFVEEYESARLPSVESLFADNDVSTRAEVTDVFTTGIEDFRVRAVVFVDVDARGPEGEQRLTNLSFVLELELVEGEWLVDAVSPVPVRSEEHTSELQSLMRISYAVFCLKKKHT